MSTYAYIYDNQIVEFKEISDQLYANWVANNNPKKDCYKLVVYTQEPSVSATEIAESTFEINQDTVDQVWTIRNKTADELKKTYTAYEFILLFTQQERTAYRNAAKTDDTVADFMELASAAHEISNDHPMTIAGMDYLVSIGVLTQARRDEILA